MNEQKPPNAIEWTRINGRRGFTWNVVSGCFHRCRWNMPDGETAICYAETVAERVAGRAYPEGFAHHYWNPDRLNEPIKLKEPAGIFLDSMSDLMGMWVPDEQIEQVLSVCREAAQHVFFLLTKNAPRLLKFEFPPNVWVGVSMPPDQMMSKPLSLDQQKRMFLRAMEVLTATRASVRWMSFEPLSWNVARLMGENIPPIEWAVIGAATNGQTVYQPDQDHVRELLSVLDRWRIPVFFKGNLHGSAAAIPWREEWPKQTV